MENETKESVEEVVSTKLLSEAEAMELIKNITREAKLQMQRTRLLRRFWNRNEGLNYTRKPFDLRTSGLQEHLPGSDGVPQDHPRPPPPARNAAKTYHKNCVKYLSNVSDTASLYLLYFLCGSFYIFMSIYCTLSLCKHNPEFCSYIQKCLMN